MEEMILWAEIFLNGCAIAEHEKRKNADWDIEYIVKLPEKPCEIPCEIVIGNRHTEFEPYVAWHCFGGNMYAWGHYCQTLEQAMECAKDKIRRELGI